MVDYSWWLCWGSNWLGNRSEKYGHILWVKDDLFGSGESLGRYSTIGGESAVEISSCVVRI